MTTILTSPASTSRPALWLKRLASLLGVACAFVSSAPAQTAVSWGTSSGLWSATGSWTGGVLPANDLTTNYASFNDPTGFSVNTDVSQSIAGIDFGSSAGAHTLTLGAGGPTTLTLGAYGVRTASNQNQTITSSLLTLTLGAATSFQVNGTGGLTISTTGGPIATTATNTLTLSGTGNGSGSISSVISGGGSVTKSGTAMWSLSGNNTYTGATTINSGTLTLGFGNASSQTNIIGSSSALVVGGGTLSMQGKASTTSAQTVNGTTINAGASAINAYSGPGGTANLTLGAITRNLGGTVSFTLPTSGSIATSAVNTNGILGGWATAGTAGTAGSSWATVSGGNIIALPSGSYTTNTWGSTLNTDVTTSGSASGATTNSLRFNTASATTLTLSGANTIESGGILVTSTVGNNATTITGGTLQASSGKDLTIIQNNTSQTAGLTITSIIAGDAGLTKSGTGSLVLTGANSYTGGTTINAGSLLIGPGGSIAGNVANNGAFGFANDSGVTFSGVISGTGTFSKAGAGTLTLNPSSVNTYTGLTSISGGTLSLDLSNLATPTDLINSSSTLFFVGGTLNVTGKNGAVTSSQSFSSTTLSPGASAVTRSINGGTATNISLGSITRMNAGSTIDFAAPGSGNITTTSTAPTGILGGWATVGGVDWATVSSNNIVAASYTNDTWGANTNVTGSAAVGSDSTTNSLRFNAATPATLTLSGLNTITSGGILVTSNVGNNATSITGGSLQAAFMADLIVIQNNPSNTLTIGSIISNNILPTSLTKSGSGALVLSGVNTYTGTTYINAGAVTVNSGASLGTGSVSVVSGATLNLNNATQSVGGLSGGGTINLGSSHALTVNTAGSSSTFSGTLAGATGSLTKSGAGTLTLSGANTYGGSTTISFGAIQIGASNVIPDTSNLTLSGGMLMLGGVFTDTLGTLNLTANSTINFGNYGGTLSFAASDGIGWTPSTTLSIMNYSTSTSHIIFGSTSGALTGTQLGQITINGQPVAIGSGGELTAVPEPATYAAVCGVGALALAMYRRRRERSTRG